MNFRVPFILASASPRRRHLLELIGASFKVEVSNADESIDETLPPEVYAGSLSRRKAEAVSLIHPEALVLGADTIVVLDGAILNKPVDEAHAYTMLRSLAKRTHDVFTGITLIYGGDGRTVTGVERTSVTFGELTDGEIWSYIRTGSPLDKAGAYGIQDDRGALLIDRIDGDYYNVVGLPLRRLYRTILENFSDLIVEADA